MPTSPASPAEKPSYEETLTEYLRTRVVYDQRPVCVLVDAFRHAAAFKRRRAFQWGQASGVEAEDAACHLLYFLSHFHSDHYTGLTSTWSHGKIFCTPGTAALVRSQLGVDDACIEPLQFGHVYMFDLTTGDLVMESSGFRKVSHQTCRVRLIPANHCPEAAIFVFEFPQPVGCVVHTGDLRYNRTLRDWQHHALGLSQSSQGLVSRKQHGLRRALVSSRMLQQAESLDSPHALLPVLTPFYEQFIGDNEVLVEVAGKVDTLFLDNTFCDPAFRFPTQWSSTQVVVETVRSLLLQSQTAKPGSDDVHVVVLIASYVIGKERVAFALQEAFHPVAAAAAEHEVTVGGDVSDSQCVPIHVTPGKYSTLRDMDFFVSRFRSLGGEETFDVDQTNNNNNNNSNAKQERDGSHANPSEREVHPVSVQVTLPVRLPQVFEACEHAHHKCTDDDSVAALDTCRALDFDPTQPTDDETPSTTSSRTRYHLTLVLVPFGALSYPLLAPACGGHPPRQRKRGRGDKDDDNPVVPTASSPGSEPDPLLSIGDGLALSLRHYDHVLAVMPTGWAKRPKSRPITRRCTQLDIPYSEHCSFDELLDFVGLVNPRHVVATVSEEQFRQQESLFVERAPRLSARSGATQPLTRFWQAVKKEYSTDEALPITATGGEETSSNHHEQTAPKATNPFAQRAHTSSLSAPASLTARAPNVLSVAATHMTSCASSGAAHRKTTQSSLTSFGVTLARTDTLASVGPIDSSDDDCVVVIDAAPAYVEISDDEEDDA